MNDVVLHADWPVPPNIVAGTTLRNASEANLPAEPQWIEQVHGIRVVKLGSADFDKGAPQADAVIGDRPGDICVVRSADCLPVLLCSFDGQEIAAVHAGWRGLAAGVIEATVAAMSCEPAELYAWLGPAISQPAFEVGDEVREAFSPWSDPPSDTFLPNDRGRWQADLFALARARLRAMGISEIHGGGVCTFDDPERFFSYRRDGSTGRLYSFIQRSDDP